MLLSIAPMIDWSYSSFRLWMRILAPRALVYTEMQTLGAIQHQPERALFYKPQEHPIALQLGGADPQGLATAAALAEQRGYDEVNLNLGCPSNKVLAGRFGACLMGEGALVAECIKKIKKTVSIPVSTKTRIGIDHQDSYAFFRDFVFQLIDAGSDKLIVHARKAWLHGLNPKQNRTIPPVQYDYVYRIKEELKTVPVIINGNIQSIEEIKTHLHYVDGVMLGRLACDNPYRIAQIHHELYPEIPLLKRSEALNIYYNYLCEALERKVPLSLLVKPFYQLAHGLPGANAWKKTLTQMVREQNISLFPLILEQLEHKEMSSFQDTTSIA